MWIKMLNWKRINLAVLDKRQQVKMCIVSLKNVDIYNTKHGILCQ